MFSESSDSSFLNQANTFLFLYFCMTVNWISETENETSEEIISHDFLAFYRANK